jgi:hypothetical protein
VSLGDTYVRGIGLILLLTSLPWLAAGQIFGQSSIASGTFLLIYLLLSLQNITGLKSGSNAI